MEHTKETDKQVYERVTRKAWVTTKFKPLLKKADSKQLKELADLIINEAIDRNIIDEVFTDTK